MVTNFTNIEKFFRQQSVLSSLLIINLLVFLLIKTAGLFCLLFTLPSVSFISFFELPASPTGLLHHPWALITYMFTHLNGWHILFNLLCLYWFGQIFLRFFGPKQLGGIYVSGGILGGLLFVLSYNIFPYFRESIGASYLIGASASTMAIIFATAFYQKELEINLILFGRVKLFYIALIFLVIDLLSIEYNNPGGHIAHIGGALTGIWFAKKQKKATTYQRAHRRSETDYEYNKRKHDKEVEIDRILDKIKHSGYNSLSENEKKKLFDASR